MRKAALCLAQLSLLLSIFLLGWMKHPLAIGGLLAIPADLMFLITGLLWLVALLTGPARFGFNSAFWLLALYFAAMALSPCATIGLSRFNNAAPASVRPRT